MNDGWIALWAALGASALTSAGTLLVTLLHDRRAGHGARATDLAAAVNEVLSLSFAVTLRAQQWGVLADHYTSRLTRLGVLVGVDRPANLEAMFEPMLTAQQQLNAATSRIWLFGDQELVRLANAVVLSSADAIGAVTSQTTHDLTEVVAPLTAARYALANEARKHMKNVVLDLRAS